MILGQLVHSQMALERLAQAPLKATVAYRLRLLLQQTWPLLTAAVLYEWNGGSD